MAVFGPDGAGKSAVIKRVAQQLQPPFATVQQFHFRPMFRREWRDSPSVTEPHGQPPRGTLISILKLLYWLADCWYGYLVTIRPARGGLRLVIFDRYLPDILIDPQRYRLPASCRWYARGIVQMAPRPDLCIVLDVPAAILQHRKPEVSPAESQRQRLAYREMLRSLPHAFAVNAVPAVEEVTDEVKRLILRSLDGNCVNRAEVSLLADV